jgi:hypothetical protein
LLVQTTTSTSNVVITGYFLATGASTIIGCANSNTSNGTGIFDNISVQAVTPAAATAPDGTQTADALTEDNSTGGHLVLANPAPLNVVQTLAFTIYAKAGTRRFIALGSNTRDNGGAYVAFDLQNGTAGAPFGGNSSSVINSSIIAVGNGWYRCQMSLAASSGGSGARFIAAIVTSLTPTFFTPTVPESYTGNGTGSVLIWGAQAEYGTAATTYNNTSVRNLLGFSEAFDNAAWVKTRCSIVTGAQANPVNGLFNAQKLMEDTTTGARSIVLGGGTVGGLETISIYAKPAGRSWLVFQIGTNSSAYFDLANGALGTLTNATASIVAVGSGWYRCSMTATRAGTTNNFVFTASANGVTSYTGDGNSGVYIYGAMLSNSASLDPYVPTPGAAPSSTAYYGPRFDYDPVTLLPRGLLIEEQRTNLLLRSEEFDNGAWGVGGLTVTANTTVAPSGVTAADTITGSTGSNAVIFPAAGFSASATSYTASCYVKAGSAAWIVLSMWQGSGTSGVNVWFNAQTGAVGSNNATAGYTFTSASSTAVGNGWYRITVTGTVPAAALFWSMRIVDGDNAFVYTNTVGDTMFIWGAQLEAGAFATSYIPTIASTVTRSADVATITGSLFSQWYRQDEGTFIAEAAQLAATGVNSRSLSANDGTVNESVQVSFLSTGNGGYGEVRDGGTAVVSITNGSFAVGSVAKMAFAVAVNNAALSVNAASPTADTSLTMPTVDRLSIGTHAGAASPLNGHIRSIRYVPVRAADFQLQQVTT